VASLDALEDLGRQLTTAPDYLLNSSLLTKRDEQHCDKINASLHWEEPSDCKGLTRAGRVSAQGGTNVKFVETENMLLKSQLASSMTENHLLAQWTSSSTTQLSHLGMNQLSHLESTYVNQKMSQLCVALPLVLTTKAKFGGTCSTSVLSSVPVGIKNTVAGSKSVMKEHATERKALDTKRISAVRKPKPKLVKKDKLAVPEQVGNVEDDSSFELPCYQLAHEHFESEKIQLFVPPEKEEMAERLMRPTVDVQSIKVIVNQSVTCCNIGKKFVSED